MAASPLAARAVGVAVLVALVAAPAVGQNITADPPICKGGKGTFFPATGAEANWPQGLQIFLYTFGLLYTFLGVGVFADVFMEAIEIITSKEVVIEAEGRQVVLRVWNATIANLSLMALGSSAPEIILSVVEVSANGFFAGELGPATIVGSAAFNLLFIIAVCMTALPGNSVRRLSSFGVFAVTAVFSVFAYIWLLIVLLASSPDVIEVWEAVVTLLLFPVLLALSYMADKGYFSSASDHKPQDVEQILSLDTDGKHGTFGAFEAKKLLKGAKVPKGASNDTEAIRKYANFVNARATGNQPVSRAMYRINALRVMQGKEPILPNFEEAAQLELTAGEGKSSADYEDWIGFATVNYRVLENCGKVHVVVTRRGNLDLSASVYYQTVNGTALAGEDFKPIAGSLSFPAGQCDATLEIEIIDDDIPENDEYFEVELSSATPDLYAVPYDRQRCRIVILDDDRPGELTLEKTEYKVLESDGRVAIKVLRENGACGEIAVAYRTKDGSAVANEDYISKTGKLVFKAGETDKTIEVEIVDDDEFELDETFSVLLENPENCDLGRFQQAVVTIENDDEITSLAEKVASLLKINTGKMRLGRASWAENFAEAVEFPDAGAPWYVKLIVLLNMPWKVIGAFIPPVQLFGGWLAFFVALAFIGLITAVIGDLASLMGCAIGLKDSVVAITFVALGTSLPDTFASRTAAIASPHADGAITNVTGSNSVNVFLGLGLTWVIASVYWAVKGADDEWRARVDPEIVREYPEGVFFVPAGDLSFSVIIFTCTSVAALCTLVLRRKYVGAELGGKYRWETAIFFVFMWIVYILLSSLRAYGDI